MIDIVFSESACGSLKISQNYRNFADVYGFNLLLSVGDISEDQPGTKRRQALEHLYSVYPKTVARQLVQKLFNNATDDLKKVRERVLAGEPTRIWYSNQPDEMCGLFWFMSQLDHWKVYDGQISIVKLPTWKTNEGRMSTRINSWGDLAPEEWPRYFELQRIAMPEFIQSCASHWRSLQKENSPLRTVLNGQLVGVPEKFYDSFIFHEIAAEIDMLQETVIIGHLLRKRPGIGYFWIALRIEEMIRIGAIEIVSDATEDMPRYNRVLKKRNRQHLSDAASF